MGAKTINTDGCRVTTDVRLESKSVACCNLEAHLDTPAEAPDYLFALLSDPNKHNSLFDSIESVKSVLLADDGKGACKWEVDYRARWKFWKVSGVMDMRVVMDTNKNDHTVAFKLREPGFLKIYEGVWTISGAPSPVASSIASSSMSSTNSGINGGHLLESSTSCSSSSSANRNSLQGGQLGGTAALASITNATLAPASDAQVFVSVPDSVRSVPVVIRFDQRMCPSVCPPFPLNQTLKGQAVGQAREMLSGLLAEARTAGMLGGDAWVAGPGVLEKGSSKEAIELVANDLAEIAAAELAATEISSDTSQSS